MSVVGVHSWAVHPFDLCVLPQTGTVRWFPQCYRSFEMRSHCPQNSVQITRTLPCKNTAWHGAFPHLSVDFVHLPVPKGLSCQTETLLEVDSSLGPGHQCLLSTSSSPQVGCCRFLLEKECIMCPLVTEMLSTVTPSSSML